MSFRSGNKSMPKMACDTREGISQHLCYSDSMEYVSNELKHLELLIRLQVLKQRGDHSAAIQDPFRGLVITNEEVDGLLADYDGGPEDENPASEDGAKISMLTEASNYLESEIRHRRAASLEKGIYLSLPHLSRLFHLTRFEEQCLTVCLAPELNRKYEKLYAYLQDDTTCKNPSVDLLSRLFCHTMQEELAVRMSFDVNAPLLRYRLLHMAEISPGHPAPLLSRALKLDDRVTGFLLGSGSIDAQLKDIARLDSPGPDANSMMIEEGPRTRIGELVRLHFDRSEPEKQNIIFHLCGPYGAGKHSTVKAVCGYLGLPLVVADAGKMLASQMPFEEMAWLLGREVVLQSAALGVENFDCLLTDDDKNRSQLKSLLKAVSTFSKLTFLLGINPWKPQGLLNEDIFIQLDFPVPDAKTRKHLWETLIGKCSHIAGDIDSGALASKFRFTQGQIHEALQAAQNLARWRSPDGVSVTEEDLYAACRDQSNLKLGALARKIIPKYNWPDIVLPSDQMDQLIEVCNQVKHRNTVYGEWGFDRKLSLGKGLNALFSGPPGTGKTMAAEIITSELHLDLYKIDLSQVVSKYIGETEKNLHHIFNEAQASNAVLFFDEADALFGKRSQVKDAHDRYANIEVGYLLQKMEEYEGIAILATNLRQNLDEAFVRRMHSIIEFPFPDEEYRQRIWKVVFPREAPLGDDVDFVVLAREVKLAGGNIKNIALQAAFYAAEDGGVIRMPHLVRAARREHQKLGRKWEQAH